MAEMVGEVAMGVMHSARMVGMSRAGRIIA
jgi:hypothetical protein